MLPRVVRFLSCSGVGNIDSMLRRRVMGGAALLAFLTPGAVIGFAQTPPLASVSATVPAVPPTGTPSAVAPDKPQPIYRDPASHVEVYDVLSEDMFPALWHSPRIAASASLMAATERNRALGIVKVALSKYPPAFLQTNLKRVYLVGSLKFKGVHVAATNSATCLYVVVKANNPLYTDRVVENSFHHEFGHLLQRKYRKQWAEDAWTACNPTGFHYSAQSGVEAVRAGHASTRLTDDWNRRGFLSEYGASDAGEDFATIAARLLLGDSVFWDRVDRFPALKAKVAVAIAFYGKLDDRFTEAYFRSLSVGVAYVDPS